MVQATVPGVFRAHLLAILALFAGHASVKAALLVGGHDHLMGLAPVLDLAREDGIANFLSAAALLACAAVAAALARAEPARGASRGWAFVALCLAFMALDEGAGLHDRLAPPLQAALGTSGAFYIAWVVPYTALAVAVGALCLPLLRSLPARTTLRLVVAGALFVGAAVGMEMVQGAVASEASGGLALSEFDRREVNRDPVVLATVAVEEVGEMAAVALALRAMLLHLVVTLGVGAVRLSAGHLGAAVTVARPSPAPGRGALGVAAE